MFDELRWPNDGDEDGLFPSLLVSVRAQLGCGFWFRDVLMLLELGLSGLGICGVGIGVSRCWPSYISEALSAASSDARRAPGGGGGTLIAVEGQGCGKRGRDDGLAPGNGGHAAKSFL